MAVRNHDEIGQLGTAFNRMADNLAEAETLRRNLVNLTLKASKPIAQGKRSAALGYGRNAITPFFFLPFWRDGGAPKRKGKEGIV